ncbi:hypothetical protein [Thauera sp. SDU_THAU2]|uniref:hypothetical protein n=1 Tax=Thauera sp. SDU_THAU2 TaxID=3136633 RepID=UPI00311E8F18
MTNANRAVRPNGESRPGGALRAAGMTVHAVAICLLAYVASARLTDATGVLLHRAGMAWTDAVLSASMAGFLYLLIVLLWAFSRRGVLRTWVSVGGLSAAAVLVMWMLEGKA